MADKKLTSSHDKFFKSLLSKKDTAAEFVQTMLPTSLARRLKVDTLELTSNEYTDKALRAHFSDLVYNCEYKVGGDENQGVNIQISLLFEHKSQPDDYPHLQLLRYTVNAWYAQIKQKKPLTPIIPIVFYHGKKGWKKRSMEDYFPPSDEELRRYTPLFDYALVDTSKYPDESLKSLNNIDLQSGLLLMKYIFHGETLVQRFTELFSSINLMIDSDEGLQNFDTFTIYLLNNTDLTAEAWEEKMAEVFQKIGDEYVSAAAYLRMSGMEEGMQRGRAEGKAEGKAEASESVARSMLREGLDDQLIIKLTGITAEQLKRLK